MPASDDSALTQVLRHQADTLRAHEQFLVNQSEYTRAFLALTQQQNALLSAGNLASSVVENVSHSMAAFVDQQTATARVHAQYIEQQTEHGRAIFQLLSGGGVALPAPVPPTVIEHSVPLPAPLPVVPLAAPPRNEPSSIAATLLEVVCETTGYPIEALDLHMDIEADLGIDSIKRVEILAGVRQRWPDVRSPRPQEFAELRTLQHIVDYLSQPEDTTLPLRDVHLTPLPPPDRLDCALAPGYVAVVTNDGTPFTEAVVDALRAIGWPAHAVDQPPSDEEQLRRMLEDVRQQQGPIGAFIHLHPRLRHATLFSEEDERIVKGVFLAAVQLKPSLEAAAVQDHAWFVAVTRQDGQLGTDHRTDIGAVPGGLAGLIKTLRYELRGVVCRSVDLDPDLPMTRAGQSLIAELFDANGRLTEVGVGAQRGRLTLADGLALA